MVTNGLRFGPLAEVKAEKPKPPKREKHPRKNDPKYIAAARELRDKYLEQVNSGSLRLESAGKYDVSRQLAPAAAPSDLKQVPLLKAA